MVEIRTFDDLCKVLLDAIHERLPDPPEGTELPELVVEFPQREDAGDLTIRLFALARPLRTSPGVLAARLAEELPHVLPDVVASGSAASGYLNLVIENKVLFGIGVTDAWRRLDAFGTSDAHAGETMLVEYAAPNTNKPLHLGHLRNIALGSTVARLLKAVGYKVVQTNLINDRGIHICKSMLAYQKLGKGETPESTGKKGDHLVGDFYVAYSQLLSGNPAIAEEAQEMLRKWEEGDPEVRQLWRTMNSWVIAGFEETLARMGVSFDRVDRESETYKLGNDVIEDGLEKGVFFESEGAVWLDLEDIGLDRKIFRRSDGTSVYITQDLGTAIKRQREEQSDGCIYVVGNEQEYHFKVLFEALKRLGHPWAANLHHLSYGMVTLPEGKMKSREGTTVDADDLMDQVYATESALLAEKEISLSEEEIEVIAQGALKFFLLKYTPRKGFQFDPVESVKLEGDTGPYVQYAHTRVASLVRNAADQKITFVEPDFSLLGTPEERALVKLLLDYPRVVASAARNLAPSSICQWLLDASKAFSRWYHDHRVLDAGAPELVAARLALAQATAVGLRNGLGLLGIGAPDRM